MILVKCTSAVFQHIDIMHFTTELAKSIPACEERRVLPQRWDVTVMNTAENATCIANRRAI
jgi:hypothetical protein